ncbi:MAG: metal ABC transporter ATP-binding protein [Erysipelotrichaceae bacterium]|nr:metal ABC transporter ATP-binding protein [Erysipelotrichaceae bacterium]
MSLITCKDVSFTYEGNTVLKDVNFQIDDNDYLCIVGENGAGKSTLMKGILKLKKPSTGSIIMSDGLKANEIGYLPQQTDVQKDFPASVFEVVLSGCLNKLKTKPFYSKKEKDIASNNMERLGIAHLKDQCFRDLSGGQKQRVLLARALCATSKVLLLDEPVAGLDPVVTQELYELIDKINKEMNITIIMVSHDIEASLKYAKHILHLHSKQLFFGSVEQYINSDVGKRFLGGQQ